MRCSGGGRVRLITVRPVGRSDEELLQLQGGLCAGCHGELALEGPTSRWGFRSKSASKVLPLMHSHLRRKCDCHFTSSVSQCQQCTLCLDSCQCHECRQ